MKSLTQSPTANKGWHRHLSPTIWLLQNFFSALCSHGTAYCASLILHLRKPSWAQLSAFSCSPRPGQIHVENYCASQTTRQTLPLWNHHSSSVSSWSFLHTSVTACHTVCSQPLAGPPILAHASACHSHLRSQTLWTSSPD